MEEAKRTDFSIPAPREDEYQEIAWAKPSAEGNFEPVMINRPKVAGAFVKFDMKYCGICHSDVHLGLNELGGCMYPIVPGHELVGVVSEIGPEVTNVKVGDEVGVGCCIDACLDCEMCGGGEENYCDNGGQTHTYNTLKGKYEAFGKKSHFLGNPLTQNFGGYSCSQVVHEHFLIKIPAGMDLAGAGPLMCAGITMYDPLVHWKLIDPVTHTAVGGKQKTVGIVGIGGLGTMGLKIAKAAGHRVVAISTTASKEAVAKAKGADVFVVSTDEASMTANAGICDFIMNTAAANHQLQPYVSLLNTNGVLVQLGLCTQPHEVVQIPLMAKRQSIAGSIVGGIKNTQGCLEFCKKHNLMPDTKLVTAKEIDTVWAELAKSNADGTRYVIDIEKSKADTTFLPPK